MLFICIELILLGLQGPLESLFLNQMASTIKHIFIHGDRTQPCCIAVVVPRQNLRQQRDNLLSEMKEIGMRAGLPLHSVPQGCVVEDATVDWTVDSGMLTSTHKLCRPRLLDQYKLAVDMEYTRVSETTH